MEIKEKSTVGLKHNYDVIISAEHAKTAFENRLNDIKKSNFQAPGFRPGKISLDLLKKRFGKSIRIELVKEWAEEGAREIYNKFAAENFEITEGPLVHLANSTALSTFEDFEKDITFEVAVELKPKITLLPFTDIVIERPVLDLNAEEEESRIQKSLERLVESMPKLVDRPQDHAAVEGDTIEIDVNFLHKNKKIKELSRKNVLFHVSLEKENFFGYHKEIYDAVIGKKAGDITNLAGPLKDKNKNLQKIIQIKILKVFQTQKYELGEEMAKSFGFENLNDLRESIKEQITGHANEIINLITKKRVLDSLEKLYSEMLLPESLVKREIAVIKREIKRMEEQERDSNPIPKTISEDKYQEASHKALNAHNCELDHQHSEDCEHDHDHHHHDHENCDHHDHDHHHDKVGHDKVGKAATERAAEELDEESIADIARRRVKLGLIMASMVKQYNLAISKEELKEQFLSQALALNSSPEQLLLKMNENPGLIEHIKSPVYEDKIVKVVMQECQVKDVPMTIDQINEAFDIETE